MLVDRGSLLRKVSDRQLTSENINFNSISNMIYGISSMIYGIGASIDISVRSVLRESRPGFPALGHDSEFKRIWRELYLRQIESFALGHRTSVFSVHPTDPPLFV
mgnify:CR=1 FL=1